VLPVMGDRPMNSRLEQRPGQKSILHVFYSAERRDWDERIREALEHHGFKSRLNVLVIAVPIGMERLTQGGR